jgi:hypothetical protein
MPSRRCTRAASAAVIVSSHSATLIVLGFHRLVTNVR